MKRELMRKLPNRKSNRLKGYNYANNGLYFITIVTQDRVERFGKIINGEMVLNDAGRMIVSEWCTIPTRYPKVELDAFVIMPNHIHGILILDYETVGTPFMGVRNDNNKLNVCSGEQAQIQNTVGEIIGSFKSLTTNRYINGVKMGLAEPYRKRLWQGRFYDHIIRNEKDCATIEQYIAQNPLNWEKDSLRNREGLMEERATYGDDWRNCL